MITVRFPTGFSIQYNSANFASRSAAYTDLLTKEGGSWVAQVPNDALIEIVQPCRMYFAASDTTNAELANLAKEVRSLKRKLVGKRGA